MEKINLNPSVTPTKAIVAAKPIKVGGYKVKIVPILLTILLVCSLVYGSYLFMKNGATKPPVQEPIKEPETEPDVDDENVNVTPIDIPVPEPPKEREFVYDFIINHEHA